ncbi:hypothetical protein [Lichenibacterium dinghuense]|uniref:hypothetical protein n=1 Tax=Lichenibacterium dinghuense TaxID=2895977 RepID=UPI001F3EA5AB|nr:hypothetical protein [Lichenibacterium sp. 6Y81]
MIRSVTIAALVAATFASVPVAFAKDIKETRTFTKADGTVVVAKTNFHTKTDVTDLKVTKTKTDGKVRTVSEKIAPNHQDGFTVSKTVTGFNGQTHSSTSTVGAGRSSTSANSGGHAGGHGKA